MDKFVDECGIVALYSLHNKEISKAAFLGLNAIQHRGQEGCGLSVNNEGLMSSYKNKGLVTEVFNEKILSLLKGNMCLGHVQYGTAKERDNQAEQPFILNIRGKSISVAFNGGITNQEEIKKELLETKGDIVIKSDAELIAHLIALYDEGDVIAAMAKALPKLQGAYAIGVLTEKFVIGARDPYGIRPLVLGRVQDGYALVSESCALDLMDGELIRDIRPGEMLIMDGAQCTSMNINAPYGVCQNKRATCSFEYIYFARPDSTIDGRNVYKAREMSGEVLAMEKPVVADIVVGVPDSGTAAAIGYAVGSEIPYSAALVKNKYVGRTFIEPDKQQREYRMKMKLNPIRQIIEGKRIVLVDDSIVRGTTMRSMISLFREYGATEVHLRISSPPVYGTCFFGVDTPDAKDLVANNASVEDICKKLGADSLGFLSIEGLLASINGNKNTHCIGCLNGSYPQFF